METGYQPRDVAGSSNPGEVQNLEDLASNAAAGRHPTAELREVPVIRGKIHPKSTVREAWKDPEDSRQEYVMDQLTNPRQDRRRNRSMWLIRTKRFCHEASVVGLRYVANPSASPFRRSIWVLLLLVGTAFTTYQIQDRIRYYLSRPVGVNFRIQHAEEIRFPTVTICNENRITYSSASSMGEYLDKQPIHMVIRSND